MRAFRGWASWLWLAAFAGELTVARLPHAHHDAGSAGATVASASCCDHHGHCLLSPPAAAAARPEESVPAERTAEDDCLVCRHLQLPASASVWLPALTGEALRGEVAAPAADHPDLRPPRACRSRGPPALG